MGKTSHMTSTKNTLMATIAAAASWAAMHEPQTLDIGSAIVWGLQTLAVALAVCAVLALLAPVLGFCGMFLRHTLIVNRNKGGGS